MTTFQERVSDFPIKPQFLERWSPRAFSDEAIPREALMTIFEAGRWAPSAFNSQPWRLIYGLRGSAAFDVLLGLLVPANQSWAAKAAALVAVASKPTLVWRGEESVSHSHSFDAGAAWQNMALQATAIGWHTHGMTGVDFARAAGELGVPSDYRLEAFFAVGRQGDPSSLPEFYRAVEAPNARNPVESFAFEGRLPSV